MQCHRVLISSPPSPSEEDCEFNPSKEQRTQLCLRIELAEEKSQPLQSQMSPQRAEHLYFKKEKNRHFEWYKNFSMQVRHISTNLSLNPARTRPEPDLQLWSAQLTTKFFLQTTQTKCQDASGVQSKAHSDSWSIFSRIWVFLTQAKCATSCDGRGVKTTTDAFEARKGTWCRKRAA